MHYFFRQSRVYAALLLMLLLLTSCGRKEICEGGTEWWEIPVVAHAGGSIDGNAATNSLEALNASVERGCRMIEVDFSVTSDRELVLLHGWDEDSLEKLGLDGTISGPVSVEEFLGLKLCGKYTPLCMADFVDWLEENPDVYIVLDVKVGQDMEEIRWVLKYLADACEQDPQLLAQFVIQLYYDEMYEIVKEVYDFPNVLYATYKTESEDPEYWREIAAFCRERDIRAVSLPSHRMVPEIIDILKENDLVVYTYTINTAEEMEEMLAAGADGICSDVLSEHDMEEAEKE